MKYSSKSTHDDNGKYQVNISTQPKTQLHLQPQPQFDYIGFLFQQDGDRHFG